MSENSIYNITMVYEEKKWEEIKNYMIKLTSDRYNSMSRNIIKSWNILLGNIWNVETSTEDRTLIINQI